MFLTRCLLGDCVGLSHNALVDQSPAAVIEQPMQYLAKVIEVDFVASFGAGPPTLSDLLARKGGWGEINRFREWASRSAQGHRRRTQGCGYRRWQPVAGPGPGHQAHPRL